jgi:hypothetical protein
VLATTAFRVCLRFAIKVLVLAPVEKDVCYGSTGFSSVQNVNSSIRIKSGESFVCGGLRRDDLVVYGGATQENI